MARREDQCCLECFRQPADRGGGEGSGYDTCTGGKTFVTDFLADRVTAGVCACGVWVERFQAAAPADDHAIELRSYYGDGRCERRWPYRCIRRWCEEESW